MTLSHRSASTREEMTTLYKSKYFQSRAWPVYKQVEEQLNRKTPVLFCGTPCQIAGLRATLPPDLAASPLLFCVEIICHGVPSPGVWNRWKQELEQKQGAALCAFDFRQVNLQEGGCAQLALFSDGTQHQMVSRNTPFMELFLRNYSLRPSCYKCNFRISHTQADLTIGDFWGVKNMDSDFARTADETKGISLCVVHTAMGQQAMEAILPQTEHCEFDLYDALAGNPQAVGSVVPPKRVITFWFFYRKGHTLSECIRHLPDTRPGTLLQKLNWYYLPACKKTVLRFLNR